MPHGLPPFLTALDGDLAPIRHVAERFADGNENVGTKEV
jgi:hypothetical protein